MDTCHGDVLPLPKDTLVGIRSFCGGLNVAFLLASVSHCLMRPQTTPRSASARVSSLLCFAVHVLIVLLGFELNGTTAWSRESPVEPIRSMMETIEFLAIAALCAFSGHPHKFYWAFQGLCFSLLLFVFQSNEDHNLIGNTLHASALLLALLNAVWFFTTDRRTVSWEQHGLTLCATVQVAFYAVLINLQRYSIVPPEAVNICLTLVSGCVRYQATVLCSGPTASATEQSTAGDDRLPRRNSYKRDLTIEIPAPISEEDEDVVEEEGEEEVEVVLTEGEIGIEDNGTADADTAEESMARTPLSVKQEVDRFQLQNQPSTESGLFRRWDSNEGEDREGSSRRKLLRYVFHEMRAPLNAISMAVELLTNQYRTTAATPRSRKADLETLQMIEESALTMERTLKDSMTLQKIEEGLLVPQVKIFSIRDMCDDVNDALSQVIRSSSVNLVYSVDEKVPDQIVGDHFRLRHVVAHVLSNAIKYSKPGGEVRMYVGLRRGRLESVSAGAAGTAASLSAQGDGDPADGNQSQAPNQRVLKCDSLDLDAALKEVTEAVPESVEFRISDDGIGMSHELQQSDIFKPFSMLKTDELKSFRGSGLGLAICKKIMLFLQGTIYYTSVPGQGTTFTVTYPLTRLDHESFDPYDSDDAEALSRVLSSDALTRSGSMHGGTPVGTPEGTAVRHKTLLSKAKSFRGQKLYTIMQTPSSVFECPTPKSSDASPQKGNFGDSNSFDHSEDDVDRGHVPPIPIPEVPSLSLLDAIAEGHCEYTPRPVTPPEGEGSAGSAVPSPNRVSESGAMAASPMRSQHKAPAMTGSPELRGRLRKARGASLTSNVSFAESFVSSAPSSFRSDSFSEMTAKLDRSASSDCEGPPPGQRLHRNNEYVALTEKNVNLHILRSGSSDVTRVLQVPGRPSPAPRPLHELLSTCKVLVVDDAASNRKLLSMLLKRSGFGKVDLVEDGQAAVDYCAGLSPGDQPSIIFMDNTMPNLTGIEAAKIIRRDGYRRLIIGVTGNSLEDELDEFIAAGADLVIVKPLKNQSIEMLLGFIQTNGFDSAHGYRIHQVGKEFIWVPRTPGVS